MEDCPHCQNKLPSEGSICGSCGAEINEEQPSDLSTKKLVERATGKIKSRRLTKKGGIIRTYLNDRNLKAYLRPSEQPEFLFKNENKGFRIRHPDGSEATPDHGSLGGRNYLLLSDQRILYVTGGKSIDETREFSYNNIDKIEYSEENGMDSRITFTTTNGTSYSFSTHIHFNDVSVAVDYVNERIEKLRTLQESERSKHSCGVAPNTREESNIELSSGDISSITETITGFSQELSESGTEELTEIINDIDAESGDELLDSIQAELSDEPTTWGLLSESISQRWPIKITEDYRSTEIRNEIFRSVHTAETGDGTAIIRWRVPDGKFTLVVDFAVDETSRDMEIDIGKQDHSGNGKHLAEFDFSEFAATFGYTLSEEPLDGTAGRAVEAVRQSPESTSIQSVAESVEYLITESTTAELCAISEISVVDADQLVARSDNAESSEEEYPEQREELEAIRDELSTVESLLRKVQYEQAESLQQDLKRRLVLLERDLNPSASRNLSDPIEQLRRDIERVLTKSHILEVLRSMDPYEFEQFVADIWAHNGWDATVTTGATDKGVDVIAKKSDAFEDRRHLIQVKRHGPNSTVGSEAIQRYAGLYARRDEDIAGVFVVTSNGFTNEAQSVAANRDVHLVDADALIERLRET